MPIYCLIKRRKTLLFLLTVLTLISTLSAAIWREHLGFKKTISDELTTLENAKICTDPTTIPEVSFGVPLDSYKQEEQKILYSFWSEIKKSELFKIQLIHLMLNDGSISDQVKLTRETHPLLLPNGLETLFNFALETKEFIKKSNPKDHILFFHSDNLPLGL